MRSRLPIFVASFLLTLCFSSCAGNDVSSGDAISGNVKTGGSTSVEKVMTALIYQFQKDNRSVTIDYEMNGSGDGIQGVLSGKYELGHASRNLKEAESTNLNTIPYAIDGIVLVVNKENAVTALTQAQVQDIYTGKITSWKEVGGKDAPITVVVREAGSGTRSAFGEIVGIKDTALLRSATECKDTGAVQTTVAQNPNAIGYMSFSDMNTSIITPVQYEGISAGTEALQDGSYKLQRSFLLITKKDTALSKQAQAFVDFILSEKGQQLVAYMKLIPVK